MFRAWNPLDAPAALARCTLALASAVLLACASDRVTAPASEPRTSDPSQSASLRTRTYYIAADLVEWNYAPSGFNQIVDQPFGEAEAIFVNTGPGIGLRYTKALYREYTDSTFTTLEPIPPEWRHLGFLGPVVRAQVGDTLRVVFRNNADHPYSFHAHGVFYDKDAEGAPYDDGTSGGDKADDAVPPGGTHTYILPVPERAGPGPLDPSSVLWMYHSHIDEPRDANTGLVGPIIITARGHARGTGGRTMLTASS
jgi:hephaestin